MFRDVTLQINGSVVEQSCGNYLYKAYIQTQYMYSKNAKEGAQGQCQIYYQGKSETRRSVVSIYQIDLSVSK